MKIMVNVQIQIVIRGIYKLVIKCSNVNVEKLYQIAKRANLNCYCQLHILATSVVVLIVINVNGCRKRVK